MKNRKKEKGKQGEDKKLKIVETTKAVGQVLCHDLTQIIRGEKKGPAFRKGHIVTEEDIPILLSMGKDHLYVWENNENMHS